jgi:H/ACA ribonucleoprotein complex subunit 4
MDKIKKLLNFGIIIIDKPSGPTSFSVSDFVRKSLEINKTSHFGTLDPQVTGVLPIALGRACRLTGFFLGHNKTYVGIIRVHKKISLEKLQGLINKNFLGKIMQLPPKKSRVKRAIREREIISFELLEKEGNDFLFITEVQGGTYIRKLCSDLGDLIGGAHMLELRRTKAGIFSEKQIVNLYDLEKAVQEHKNGNSKLLEKIIIPAETAIKEIVEFVQAKSDSLKKILTGKPLEKTDLKTIPKQDLFAVFNKEEFLEIAEKIPNDSFFARPKFVLN